MEVPDYYSDLKFCPKCQKYVSYLMGMEHLPRRMWRSRKPDQDWVAFNDTLTRQKPKGGRPRRDQRGRESA